MHHHSQPTENELDSYSYFMTSSSQKITVFGLFLTSRKYRIYICKQKYSLVKTSHIRYLRQESCLLMVHLLLSPICQSTQVPDIVATLLK